MPKGRKPTMNARVKVGDIWTTIGVGWKLEGRDGYSLKLNLIPVNFDGAIVLLPMKSDDEPKE